MSNQDIDVLRGMLLSMQAILKEASARLSHGGTVVGSPQDHARTELATAAQAIEMTSYWATQINH